MFEALDHSFEEDSLVGGLLVEKYQAAVGLEKNVDPPHKSDEPQWNLEQRRGRGWKLTSWLWRQGLGCGDKMRN